MGKRAGQLSNNPTSRWTRNNTFSTSGSVMRKRNELFKKSDHSVLNSKTDYSPDGGVKETIDEKPSASADSFAFGDEEAAPTEHKEDESSANQQNPSQNDDYSAFLEHTVRVIDPNSFHVAMRDQSEDMIDLC